MIFFTFLEGITVILQRYKDTFKKEPVLMK